MKRVHKFFMLLVTLALVFDLAACGTGSESSKADDVKTDIAEGKEKAAKKESDKQQKSQDNQAEDSAIEEKNAEDETEAGKTIEDQGSKQQQTAKISVAADKTQSQPQTNNQSNNATVTPQNQAPVAKPKQAETVTISIIGPENKRILSATKVEIKAGDTVFDVLLKIAAQKGIEVDYEKNYGSVYVKGIDGYYEGDYEGQSGWTYKLNGVLVQKSAGDAIVKSGDTIVWEYVGD